MGFLGLQEVSSTKTKRAKFSPETLRAAGCSACPLNNAKCRTPKMDPAGSENPLIYFLGMRPERLSDIRGRHFQDVQSGEKILRFRLPPAYTDEESDDVRWNYITRTHSEGPLNNAAVEACRNYIVEDIERTKPKAIFGFGNEVLSWVLGGVYGGSYNWSGRKVPVKIGKHKCWFYPFIDLRTLKDRRKWEPTSYKDFPSDFEFAFDLHLNRALAEVPTLEEPHPHDADRVRDEVYTITGANGRRDVEAVLELLDAAANVKADYGFDYETNRLRPYEAGAKILSFGLSGYFFEDHVQSYAVALDHRESEWSTPHRNEVWKALQHFHRNHKCRLVSHQLGFELEWTAFFFGAETVWTPWEDSLAQAYVLDERKGTHSLEFLGMQHFGINLKKIAGVDRKDLDAEPLHNVLVYNAADAKYHRALYKKQKPLLYLDETMEVYRHTRDRIPAIVLTQMHGVPVDQDIRQDFTKTYTAEIKEATFEIRDLPDVAKFERKFDREFNPGSTTDVKAIFKMLGKNLDSADEATLSTLKHKLAPAIIKLRKPSKILSTYIEPLTPGALGAIFPDGLLHPILNTCTVDTWRTSSDSPNIQNYPKRSASAVVRKCVTKSGYKVVAFDYAGIQGRNVAMESKDRALVNAFWNKYDIHTDWLHKIAEYVPSWVPGGHAAVEKDKDLFKWHRHLSKNKFVFPAFFGAQAPTLAAGLGIERDEAEHMREMFFDEFPDIHRWHKQVERDFNRTGYVTGLSGHRRHAPISVNQLINAPIQADESLIVMSSMIALSKLDPERFQPMFEIHDDLTFLWPESEVEKRAETVITEMTRIRFDWINTPLEVEMSVGNDWYELKEVGKFEWKPGEDYWAQL